LTIQIQNGVASAAFNQTFDLTAIANAFPRDTEFKGRFPALICRWKSPKVIFLVFSTGKIVCVGARKEKDIYEAIEKLQRKLEQSEVLIRS